MKQHADNNYESHLGREKRRTAIQPLNPLSNGKTVEKAKTNANVQVWLGANLARDQSRHQPLVCMITGMVDVNEDVEKKIPCHGPMAW
jgi:hypothetical protein